MIASDHDKNRAKTRGLLITSGVALRLPRTIGELHLERKKQFMTEGEKSIPPLVCFRRAQFHYEESLFTIVIGNRAKL